MTEEERLLDILEGARIHVSNIKPSDWVEQNRVMTPDVSPIPGRFSYDNSPYIKELIDCLATDHPAKIVAVMKGAQIGFSTGLIEGGIGWIISQNPGNIMFNVGHDELVEEAITKVDRMIDACGIRHLIRPSVKRAKNMKTGDTNRRKEFPNGYLVCGVPNHKLYRNRSIQYGFIDDFEAAKGKTKQAGDTTQMIEQRFAAYKYKMKLFYISTPELKQGSNIEPVYELGDKRKYFIPCPCCGEFIDLHWSIKVENSEEMGGITWKLDENNRIVPGSVGYVCQKCGDFFKDTNKDELLRKGEWRPTDIPKREGYYSYQISSLYAPTYMYDWGDYVEKYLMACPPGQPINEDLYKTFINLCLGETYEEVTHSPKANRLQMNIRNYEVGTIPDSISMADGNGKIMLLTCACDLNGVVDDARLDYEIVGWSESGASYGITHGSIGTFVIREGAKKEKPDRPRWTYDHHRANSVWFEMDKILDTIFTSDVGGRKMKVFFTGVDTGHYSEYAYPYVDNNNRFITCLKGDSEVYLKVNPVGINQSMRSFKIGQERTNLYLVKGNKVKDDLSARIGLSWSEGDGKQPPGFMNFPSPSGGKYQFKNYFQHYESEHKIPKKDALGMVTGMRWEKRNTIVQNHFWDVCCYNMVLVEIYMHILGVENGRKDFTWKEYCDEVKKLFKEK